MKYSITPVYDHYEVYINGKFYCSADTWFEAVREIEEYQKAMCLAQHRKGNHYGHIFSVFLYMHCRNHYSHKH